MSAIGALQALEQRQPEWKPWLASVRAVLIEIERGEWNAAVPERPIDAESDAPLLCATAIRMDPRTIERLLDAVRPNGARDASAYRRGRPHRSQLLALFESALNADEARLRTLAHEWGADPDAFTASAALLPIPLLHACRAQWASRLPDSFSGGYCPVCGAWPAFAEVRGIERSRYLRCARCGSAWHSTSLWCPYCNMNDHESFDSLVVEQSTPPCVIDACTRCGGYVKAFTRLQGAAPTHVMLDDLATAPIDFCAAQRGYHRRAGLGRALRATVVHSSGSAVR
jgi:FdhE protein